MAKAMGGVVKHTDDLIHLGWGETSLAASFWFDDWEVDVVEGVAVARALRKWLDRGPVAGVLEEVIYLTSSKIELGAGQEGMAKSDRTVWEAIKPELIKRGIMVTEL